MSVAPSAGRWRNGDDSCAACGCAARPGSTAMFRSIEKWGEIGGSCHHGAPLLAFSRSGRRQFPSSRGRRRSAAA